MTSCRMCGASTPGGRCRICDFETPTTIARSFDQASEREVDAMAGEPKEESA